MNYKNILKSMRYSISLAASLVMISSTASAIDLAAVPSTWTSSNGTAVPMWGFINDTGVCPDPAALPAWDLGPTLTDTDLAGGDLTINLRNCLTEPVSIVIPGQTAQYSAPVRNADGRIVSFTKEAPADGGASLTEFVWLGVNANTGSFLYQSGSYVAKQVHMGLYGVLKVGSYLPGTVSREVTLVYSEIDPNLHATAAAATPLTYKPSYFLLNGKEQHEPVLAGDLNLPTVLNFLNAGLDFHVPALEGDYMQVTAEDGNLYPYPQEQYSVNLAAGKTKEAWWTPTESGEYPLFDRRGHGMPVKLVVVNDAAEPFAQNDRYGLVNNHGWTDMDNPQAQLSVTAADGLLANDYPVPPTAPPVTDAPTVVSGPTGTLECESAPGVVSPGLCPDGSFIYTPDGLGFDGPDTFTYSIPGSTTDATVTIDVNAGPMAVADGTTVWRKSKPGKKDKGDPKGTDRNTIDLLANDSDTSMIDPTSVVIIGEKKKGKKFIFKTGNGKVKNMGDGTIKYTPKKTFTGDDTFTYTVKDIQGAVSNEATVTITVVKKLADLPPFPPL